MTEPARALLPTTAPFASEEIEALNRVLGGSSSDQRHWLAGFLAGVAAATGRPANDARPQPAARATPAEPLLILYGTESGNAEAVAGRLAAQARKRGFRPTLKDMAEATPADAASAKNLVALASTWGEGDPPQRAEAFWRALLADPAPRMDGVRFSVLALGDTAYANFCEVGRRMDARLAELGGVRVLDRGDCDLDFEAPAAAWSERAIAALAPVEPARAGAEIIPFRAEPASADEAAWTRSNPFMAELLERVTLSGSRSTKQNIHLELSLAGSGLAYEPGDSLAVVPENDPRAVEAVLGAVGLAGDRALAARLGRELDVTTLSRSTIEAWHRLRPQPGLAALLEGDAWRGFVRDRQIVDLLEAFPANVSAAELAPLLRPLPARSYSIASSPLAHPDEAHLLVGVVRWESHGRARGGVASTWMAERLAGGGTVPVFLKPNRHFRLPADGDVPVVMVGPGTGIAPFRAFLEQRRETGAKGKSWLVFGERTSTHDFSYQTELQEMEQDGVLARIDVAFSRDQPEKIYVQHRLWEARADLWAWLQEGASLYLCGDAATMAKDVEATLLKIAAERGGLEHDAARSWLDGLVASRRFQRDVY